MVKHGTGHWDERQSTCTYMGFKAGMDEEQCRNLCLGEKQCKFMSHTASQQRCDRYFGSACNIAHREPGRVSFEKGNRQSFSFFLILTRSLLLTVFTLP